jgi:hypothetical protein
MDPIEALSHVYSLKSSHWPERLPEFERLTGARLIRSLTDDDYRNLERTYHKLFSGEGQLIMSRAFWNAAKEFADSPDSARGPLLTTLRYLHTVIAAALWRYDVRLGPEFEEIARNYDRLDLNFCQNDLLRAVRERDDAALH